MTTAACRVLAEMVNFFKIASAGGDELINAVLHLEIIP